MKSNLILIVLLGVAINSCKESTRKPNAVNVQQDNCLWIKHDQKLLADLFKNPNAKSISDSFIFCLYINNYRLKIKPPELNDSISLLQLRIAPYITTKQYGGIYELSYAFTDSNCSMIYDSLVKSNVSFIYGIRFSAEEGYVESYLSTDRPFVIDPNFMDVERKVKEPDFIKAVRQNEFKINDTLKAKLRQLKIL